MILFLNQVWVTEPPLKCLVKWVVKLGYLKKCRVYTQKTPFLIKPFKRGSQFIKLLP